MVCCGLGGLVNIDHQIHSTKVKISPQRGQGIQNKKNNNCRNDSDNKNSTVVPSQGCI